MERAMIPRYRAYDSGSLCRMYSPEGVWVCDDNIWVVDDDSCNGELILNNDIHLMQSTGLFDKDGKEIFEDDIIAIEVDDTGMPINAKVFQNRKIGVLMFHVFEDNEDVPMVELLEDDSVAFKIIGNIWEDGELLDVENTELAEVKR